MPLFKKISVDSGSLLETHRKSLRQCRSVFLQDLDVLSVMDYMVSDEGFRHDQKDAILSMSTREQQAAMFLDHLESRGERAFALFTEALKARHKRLYTYLDETIRTVDEWETCQNSEKASVNGLTLRKMLLKRKRESVAQNSDDSENATGRSELQDDCFSYIKCYSITTKGHQQKESWITHVDSCRSNVAPAEESSSYMAVVTANLIFKRLDWTAVKPNSDIKKPLNLPTYVFEKENSYVFSSASKQLGRDFADSSIPVNKRKTEPTEEEKESKNCIPTATIRVRSSIPPPVPPKPTILPVLGLGCNPPLPKPRRKSDILSITPPLRTTSKISLPGGKTKPLVPKNKPSFRIPSRHSTGNASTVISEAEFSTNNSLSMNCKSKNSKSEICKLINVVDANLEDVGDDVVSLDYNISVGSTLEPEDDIGDDNTDDSCTSSGSAKNFLSHGSLEDRLDINENMTKNETADDHQSDREAEGPQREIQMKSTDSDEQTLVETNPNPNPPQIPDVVGCLDLDNGRICSMTTSEDASVQYDLPPPDDEYSSTMASKSTTADEAQGRPKLCLPLRSVDQPVFADDEFSSDNSYYEEIEQFFCRCSSPSCVSYNTYLDPRTSMLKKRASNRSSHHCATEELRKSGRKYLCQNSLLLVSSDMPCTDLQFPDDSRDSANPESESPSPQELDSCSFSDTLLCFDRDGCAFCVPSKFLKKYGDPEGELWFYPVRISAREASLFLLSVKQEGCFVVYRPDVTSSNVAYNLSLYLANNDVVHYHILENAHGDYGIEGHDHTFMTLGELIEYFRRNKSSLATRLRRPLRIANHPITPGFHYDICYELNRNDILLTGSIIGQGNFGVVCAGLYRNSSVAVKVLQQADNLTSADEDDFIEEALAMMRLKHDHIVRLIGVSCKMRPYFLVSEYMSQGNLKDCLRSGFISSDNINGLFSVCLQVVSAMQYLENIRYMLHRDLAARNFLVDDNLGIKLADFGRARIVSDDCYQAPRTEKICIKWAAPEVLIYSHYSTKSDVWSFGVVLWEVFSAGARPFGIFSGEQTAMYVTGGGRLDKPPGCPSELYEIMKSCWLEDLDDRPSFCELSQTLKSKSKIYVTKSSVEQYHNGRLSSDAAKLCPVSSEKNPADGKSTSSSIFGTTNSRKAAFYDNRNTKSDTNSENLVQCKSDARYVLNHDGPLSNYLSDLSIATASSEIMDIDREDVSRGDRIRKSLRKLITKKSKTKFNELGGKMVPALHEFVAAQ